MEGSVLNIPLHCPYIEEKKGKGKGKRRRTGPRSGYIKPGFTAQRLFEQGGAMDRIRHALLEFKPHIVFLSAGFVSEVRVEGSGVKEKS